MRRKHLLRDKIVGRRTYCPSELGRCPIRAQIRLDPQALSARRARRFVAETLQSWTLSGPVDENLVDVATLLVSELVTNAVVHAGSPALLVVRPSERPGCVRVEVCDQDAEPPIVHAFDPDATDGRGLALVAALADRWGVQPTAVGKSVWFELVANVSELGGQAQDGRVGSSWVAS
jgi:anti-sigma regulatory factor (Ser/Thr protein kinase)